VNATPKILTNNYDVSNASFVDNFSVSAQDTIPQGMAFNNDGTKLYVVGDVGNDINEYDLAIPFDVSTGVFVDTFDVSAQETVPQGMAFNNDGTKLYMVGDVGNDINEYDLAIPFDVSTGVFVDTFDVSAQDTNPSGMAFNNDGTKLYMIGVAGLAIYEYDLLTAFDVSTGIFNDNFSVSAQDTFPIGMAFNNDGTKLYMIGLVADAIREYDLLTAFDVSTGVFNDSFNVSAQETNPTGLAFNNDGTKLYVIGNIGDTIHEYDVGSVIAGATVQSNNITILNSVPTLAQVILNSTDTSLNDTNQNLTAFFLNVTDVDGDDVKNITNWFVNGSSIAVLNMPFEGGSTATFTKDYTPFVNNGTVNGAIFNSSGGHDGFSAYNYDGANDYIEILDDSSLDFGIGESITLSVWIKPSSLNGFNVILSKGRTLNTNNLNYALRLNNNVGTVSFYYNDGVTFPEYRTTNDIVNVGEYYHIALTYTFGDGDSIALYVNGTEQNASFVIGDGTSAPVQSAEALWIGAENFTGGEVVDSEFIGHIDDVVIYNRSLSAGQILALYENKTFVIVSNETSKGDTWFVNVTPNDGTQDGTSLISNNITIISEVPPPNISLLKIADRTEVGPEQLIVYTINITNIGGSTAINVTVGDILSSNVTFINASPPANDTNLTFIIGNITVNGTSQINITVNVTSDTPDDFIIENTANATFFNQTDGLLFSVNSSVNVTVMIQPDQSNITLTKSADKNETNIGSLIIYTVNVTNIDGQDTINVTLTDIIPTGTVFVNSSPPFNDTNFTYLLGTIVANASTNITITVNVSTSLANGTLLVNTVNSSFINASGILFFSNNATANVTALIPEGLPNLTITKAADKNESNVGSLILYTINITNTGNSTAFNVTLTDIIPTDTIFVNSTPPVNDTNLTIIIDTIGPGKTASVNITVNVSVGTQNGTLLINTINSSFTNISGTVFFSNNATANVTALIPEGAPNVTLTKAADKNESNIGALITYNINLTNNGNSTAFNVTLTDILSPNVTFINSSPPANDTNFTFIIGTIGPGKTTSINITVNVTSGTQNGTLLINSINSSFFNITGTIFFSNNATANVTALIPLGQPNITIIKSGDINTSSGEIINFTINVTNHGNQSAINVTIGDILPDNTSFVNSSPPANDTNVTFLLGEIGIDETVLINITLNTTADIVVDTNRTNIANGTFLNATGTRFTIENTTFNFTIGSLFINNLTVIKTAISVKNAGRLINYTINLTNDGNVNATNITVTDILPNGTIFINSTPPANDTNLTFLITAIEPNQSFVITITFNTSLLINNGTNISNLVNTSFISRSGAITFAENSTINVTITLTVTPPNITINKTASRSTPSVGTLMNYTINITNTGESTAFNVTVGDILPTNVSFINSTPPFNDSNLTYIIGNLTANESIVIIITVNITTNVTNGTILTNIANATFFNESQALFFSENSTVNVTAIRLPPDATLVVTKNDTPDPVTNGSILSYTINITNIGLGDAFNVTVTDFLPVNVSLNSTSLTSVTGTNTTFFFNLSNQSQIIIIINVSVNNTVNGSQLFNLVNITFINSTNNSKNVTANSTTLAINNTPPVCIKNISNANTVKFVDLPTHAVLSNFSFNDSEGDNLTFTVENDPRNIVRIEENNLAIRQEGFVGIQAGVICWIDKCYVY